MYKRNDKGVIFASSLFVVVVQMLFCQFFLRRLSISDHKKNFPVKDWEYDGKYLYAVYLS